MGCGWYQHTQMGKENCVLGKLTSEGAARVHGRPGLLWGVRWLATDPLSSPSDDGSLNTSPLPRSLWAGDRPQFLDFCAWVIAIQDGHSTFSLSSLLTNCFPQRHFSSMNPRLVILLLEPVLSTEVSQVWCGGSHKMLLGISGGCRQPLGGRVQQKVSLVSRLDGAPFPSSLRRLHLCAPPQFPVHSRRHLPALKPNFFFFFQSLTAWGPEY